MSKFISDEDIQQHIKELEADNDSLSFVKDTGKPDFEVISRDDIKSGAEVFIDQYPQSALTLIVVEVDESTRDKEFLKFNGIILHESDGIDQFWYSEKYNKLEE